MIDMYGSSSNFVHHFVTWNMNKAEKFLTLLYLQKEGVPSLLWKVMKKTFRGGKMKVQYLKTA